MVLCPFDSPYIFVLRFQVPVCLSKWQAFLLIIAMTNKAVYDYSVFYFMRYVNSVEYQDITGPNAKNTEYISVFFSEPLFISLITYSFIFLFFFLFFFT